MNRRTALVAAAASASLAGTAQAQSSHAGHGAPTRGNEPASTREFRAANNAMHRAMEIRYSGNADRDFVAGMIPHHEGAIEMARIVLRHGSDSEVKRLAEEIIRTQQAEIAQMRAILARLPAR